MVRARALAGLLGLLAAAAVLSIAVAEVEQTGPGPVLGTHETHSIAFLKLEILALCNG
jgi:hypothetical protein